jgi:hypothetical protein
MAILLICGMGAYLWALAPAIRWDSLSYHIPVPLHYIANHGITEMPESYQASFVHYAEMLYVLGLMIKPATAIPNLLHFEIGVLTALLIYIFGKKLGGKLQGILASIIFWSLPIIQNEIGSAYIDLFSTAFLVSFLYILWVWFERSENRWLFLAGCFAGVAIGIKITTFIPILTACLIFLIRAFQQSRSIMHTLKRILVLVAPLLTIAAPWFIRDWILMGNPIFPMYDQIFHSPKAIQNAPSFAFTPTTQKISGVPNLPIALLFKSRRYYQ